MQEQLDHYMPNNLDTRNLITGDDIMVKASCFHTLAASP